MDDNKDILTSENEAEENTASDKDTYTEETTALDDDLLNRSLVQDLDLQDENATQGVQTAVKKKPLVQVPVIISAVVVVIAALVLFVIFAFFDKSIEGTWLYVQENTQVSESTEDEASVVEIPYYYSFEKDGTASVTIGSIKYVGTYSIETDEETDEQSLTVYVPNMMQGTLGFNVSGNIFSGRTLTIFDNSDTESAAENQIVLKAAKYTEPKLEREGEFTPSDDLTGKWVYDDGLYNISFDLREDGTATYSENNSVEISGIYSYDDTTVTITYYTIEEALMNFSYELSDDTILINGIPFTNVDNATADEQ